MSGVIKLKFNAVNAAANMSNPRVTPFGSARTAALPLPRRMNS
jgi:hypothetical protein